MKKLFGSVLILIMLHKIEKVDDKTLGKIFSQGLLYNLVQKVKSFCIKLTLTRYIYII